MNDSDEVKNKKIMIMRCQNEVRIQLIDNELWIMIKVRGDDRRRGTSKRKSGMNE